LGAVQKRRRLLIAGVAVIFLLIVAAGINTSPGLNIPVAVYPTDESFSASPTTQISFRGAKPSALTGIEVTGSETGHHDGKLKAHSDGWGASFVPDKPFQPDEEVTVDGDFDVVDTDDDGKVKFDVYDFPLKKKSRYASKVKDPSVMRPGFQSFVSEPGLRPPTIRVTRKEEGRAPGHVFLGVKAGPGQDGPMITDEDGKLIWFHQVPKGKSVFDFRTQEYQGEDVLTWWEGLVRKGFGFGYGVIYDSHYRPIKRVYAGNGYYADLHEFELTKRNSAFLISYKAIKANLKRIVHGTENAAAVDCIVQEIDIPTGLVMMEWHARDHLKLHDAFNPYSNPHKAFDFAHVNSVFEEQNGNLLISARNAGAILEVDRASGRTAFRLGGKRPNIPQQPNTFTIAQHAATRTERGAIGVFDNGAGAPPESGVFKGRPARGLILRQPRFMPGMPPLPVFVEHELTPDKPRFTYSQGNVQELENNGFMVGWGGDQPWFSEFSNDGQLVYDAHMIPETLDTYRAYKLKWTGHPEYPPKVVVRDGAAYVSWNGMTNVHRWQLLAGSDPNGLRPVGDPIRRRWRYEMRIPIPPGQQYVAVRGLGKRGKTLGTSAAVSVSGG
jgi:hypothetical protein